MISILILTRNEERDLPGCLQSVAWSDDVWVLDSGSTDRTAEIAGEHGARVVTRVFDNWAAHQNWAVRNIPFRHSWVFYLDADERVTDGLRKSLWNAAASPGDSSAFEVRRRDFLDGTWLRHAQLSAWYTRLFRPGLIRYQRLVNPVTLVDGSTGRIDGYLDHFPFSKCISFWMQRHNDYSTREAQQILLDRSGTAPLSLRGLVFGETFAQRRRQQKELFYRLPGRPLLKFLLIYLFRMGFLDGRAGMTYALLQSMYEYLIVLKTREMTKGETRKGPSIEGLHVNVK